MAALTTGRSSTRRPQLPAHTPGTPRGEELVRKFGREAGRERAVPARTARDATSVNARGPRADRPADAPSSAGVSGTSRAQAIPRTRRRRHESRRARRRHGLTALASLRRYVRPRAAAVRERCELCDAELATEHSHLVEPATRRLACAVRGVRHAVQRPGRGAISPRAPSRPIPGRLPPDGRGLGRPLPPHRPGLLRAQHAGGGRHRPVSQPGGRDGGPGVARGVGGAGGGEPGAPRPRAGRRGPAGEPGRRGPANATASASTSATSSSASSA